MAINLNYGDSSPCSSPRLSFSHDVTERNPNPSSNNEEFGENRLDDISLLSSEFNFCVFESCPESETFPADDLFYNGVIIPTQMKQKLNSMKQEQELTTTTTTTTTTTLTTATIVREQRTPSSKSMFWGFRRSSSLNCENNNEYKKSLSRWSMPHLFRSKSTGSSSSTGYHHHHKQSHKNSSSNNNNGKLMMNNNNNNNNNNNTNNNNNNNGSSSNNQWVKFPASSSASQKPPVLKKSGSGGGGSYVNVLRNNGGHALNVPPPYIAKGTSDLLGFGSFFRHGIKDKKTKN